MLSALFALLLDGGFTVVGNTNSWGAGLRDALIVEYDPYVTVKQVKF